MELTKKLVMTFTNQESKKVSIAIDDPREDITEAEIKATMELILAKNIFAPNGYDLVSIVDAKIVVTDTTEFDLIVA